VAGGTAVAARGLRMFAGSLRAGNGLLVTKGRSLLSSSRWAPWRCSARYRSTWRTRRVPLGVLALRELESSAPLGIPLPAFILVGLAAALAFISDDEYGRYTRAVG